MPDDQAQTILSPAPVDNSIKASAWEAFKSSQNQDELGMRLQGINLPTEFKAQLWEAKKASGAAAISPEQAQINQLPAPAAQSRQEMYARVPGLTRDTGLYPNFMNAPADQDAAQMKSILSGATGTPDVSRVSPEQASVGMGGGLLAGSAFASPVGTATGLATGYAGEQGLKFIARESGASPAAQEMWGKTGNIVGSLFGLKGGSELENAAENKLRSLFRASPARVASINEVPAAKEAVENGAAQLKDISSKFLNNEKAAMGLDPAPANVAATKNLAQQAMKDLKQVATVPQPLKRVAGIPEPPQNVLTSDDPTTILEELAGHDNIPFAKAQEYQTAIEQYIRRTSASGPAYRSLKAVSNSLGDAMDKTAMREGGQPKLDQLNRWRDEAEKHSRDFNNDDAPLKPFVEAGKQNQKLGPSSNEGVFNQFFSSIKDSRVLEALERRGFDTSRIRAVLGRGDKALAKDIADASTLRTLKEPELQRDIARKTWGETKETATKSATSTIAGASVLYQLYQRLAKQTHR